MVFCYQNCSDHEPLLLDSPVQIIKIFKTDFFENSFNKDTMHKKIPKICTECRVSAAKIYLYHSTEIAKARPHSKEC